MQATIFIHLWLCNSTNDTNIFLSVLITTFWINYDRRTVQNLLAPTHYSKKEVVLFRAIMIISRVRLLKFLFQVHLLLCWPFLSICTIPAPMGYACLRQYIFYFFTNFQGLQQDLVGHCLMGHWPWWDTVLKRVQKFWDTLFYTVIYNT